MVLKPVYCIFLGLSLLQLMFDWSFSVFSSNLFAPSLPPDSSCCKLLIQALQSPVSSVGVALSANLGRHIHWANYLSLTCLCVTFFMFITPSLALHPIQVELHALCRKALSCPLSMYCGHLADIPSIKLVLSPDPSRASISFLVSGKWSLFTVCLWFARSYTHSHSNRRRLWI